MGRTSGGRTGRTGSTGSTAKKPSGAGPKKPGSTGPKTSGGRTTKKPGTGSKKPGSTTKKPGTGPKKPGGTAKKPGTGSKKTSTAKKPRKPVKSKVKNALRKRGLARSFRSFKHRWWSNRWKNWLFYNSLDSTWYTYAPETDCFVPADYCAYDPPEECEEGDEECGCPPQAMQCPVLPPDDVNVPEEPSNTPWPLPGVENEPDQPSGCCCCKCKTTGKSCGSEGCRCSEE
jgi:hypothetical protein